MNKIIQISTVYDPEIKEILIYGLSNNGGIFMYDNYGTWQEICLKQNFKYNHAKSKNEEHHE